MQSWPLMGKNITHTNNMAGHSTQKLLAPLLPHSISCHGRNRQRAPDDLPFDTTSEHH
jgi:hypothetical protein